MTLRFPSVDRVIKLSMLAGAAVRPIFAELDEAERATLLEAAQQELSAALQRYIQGDEIVVPMAHM